MSEGVVGGGIDYFSHAAAAGLEGVMAKRLDSPYRTGVRSDDWFKIKARRELLCIVIGYEPSADDDAARVKSLVVASSIDGELKCVGRVGSGLSPTSSAELLPQLLASERSTPVVPCGGARAGRPRWVEPRMMCRVSYAEMTSSGQLRQAAFLGWVDTPGGPT